MHTAGEGNFTIIDVDEEDLDDDDLEDDDFDGLFDDDDDEDDALNEQAAILEDLMHTVKPVNKSRV